MTELQPNQPQSTAPQPTTPPTATTTPSCLAGVEVELSELLWDMQPARSPTVALTRIKHMVRAAYRAGIRHGATRGTRVQDQNPSQTPPARV